MATRASAAGAAGVTAGGEAPAPAKAKRAAKAKAAPLSAEELRGLAAKADETVWYGDKPAFEKRIEALGVSIKFSTGTYAASGHGVRGSSTEGPRAALRNWANAARREAARR